MASSSRNSRGTTNCSFILILCFSFISSSQLLSQACHDVDRLALLGFKAQITSDSGNLRTWNASTDCCTWEHITCDTTTGRVVQLNIPGTPDMAAPDETSTFPLTGTLSPTLGNLSSLEFLKINNHYEGLVGPIPPELGNLQNLTVLYLWGNHLSGSIPSSLGNLVHLEALDLSYNQLSGVIPPSLSLLKNLTSIGLEENQFTGRGAEYDNLRAKCDRINADIQARHGFFPLCLKSSQACHDVDRAALLGFKAQITSDGGNLKTWNASTDCCTWEHIACDSTGRAVQLNILSIPEGAGPDEDTSFPMTGTLSPTLRNLSSIELLKINGHPVAEPIPTELGNLRKLTNLNLGFNKLNGSIPSSFGNLINLEYLDLSYNHLSGVIPSALQSLTKLIDFEITTNQITGEIPPEIGNLRSLNYLSLGSNKLNGSIPSSLGNLVNLKSLYLFDNQLSSVVPSSLHSLKNLTTIVIS
ncbi:hypothetical protein NE237_023684 [Protea cynaroides]|uniref:Leucine-rich repeat-containing N-terminal plant-type domain-containing protein n=1 Tax=Protea cynaroides TaxID=273540 RepID=A0A9Q0HFI7_9MAGN|nr:hypothetical protein NE237_023684 [Protea cynaroides]